MLTNSRQQRQQRIRELVDLLEQKKNLYFEKAMRARSTTKHDYWYGKYSLIRKITYQYYENRRMAAYQFGEVSPVSEWLKSQYKRAEVERIESGKQKFLNMHFYSPWFFGTSLSGDYGTYTCDRCGRTFHHSPSKITRAAKTVFECCCGYCTNEIILRDHKSTPYT